MDNRQHLLWIGPGDATDRVQIETVARELDIGVTFCRSDQAAERLDGRSVDIVCLEIAEAASLALLQEVHESSPGTPVFVASSDTSVATMRTALQRGATDFVTLPLNPLDLSRVLIKASQLATGPAGRRVSGQVITLYGVRGGLGTTTLAVNLAVRLHEIASGEVAIVDLDLHRGDVAAFLNLTPSQSIAAIGEAPSEVDEIFLHSAMTRYGTGLFVLAAPDKIEDADVVGHNEATLALRLLRTQYAFTIVDTARALTAPTVAAFEQADQVLVLSDLTVPGVRSAQRSVELLERLGVPYGNIHLIVSRLQPGPVQIDDAVKAIGRAPYLIVPRDDAAASAAMNSGTPLNGTSGGGLAETITEFAAKIAGTDAGAFKRKGGLLRRFFSREARS
jgi:pilus assembly protein CpaE